MSDDRPGGGAAPDEQAPQWPVEREPGRPSGPTEEDGLRPPGRPNSEAPTEAPEELGEMPAVEHAPGSDL